MRTSAESEWSGIHVDNIDALMLRRYENKKLLRAGKHPKGSAKRTKEQDVKFADGLEKILSSNR